MEAVFIRKANRHFRIPFDSILFLKASGTSINLTTSLGEFSLPQNLSQFEKTTSFPSLFRVHRSYLINLEKVESFDNEGVWINKIKIPISEGRRREFLDHIHCV